VATQIAERKKEQSPLLVLKTQIDQRQGEFARALPAHIPVERFTRVIMTAVQSEPDLLTADRSSFLTACLRSAQDGLLPDKRDGAIVIYNSKVKREGKEAWIKMAQWMPMIGGILKKVRNSGKLATITARVVYGGDHFRYWVDDDGEHVDFEPSDSPDKSIVRRVFAMAKTTDGELYVEPLTADDIEKIRSVSRSRDKGPWVDWWEEMAKKSALRRLAKRLPNSSDLDDLLRRDDELYDLHGASDRVAKGQRPRLEVALDELARPLPAALELRAEDTIEADTSGLSETDATSKRREVQWYSAGRSAEIKAKRTDSHQEQSAGTPDGQSESARSEKEQQSSERTSAVEVSPPVEADIKDERRQSPEDLAFDRGWRDRERGLSRRAVPGEYRQEGREAEAQAWQKGFDQAPAGGEAK
jgi:recombination protein RecT